MFRSQSLTPGVVTGALLLPASAAIVVSLVALLSLRSLGETAARIDSAAAAVQPHALVDRTVRRPVGAKPLAAVIAAVRAAERGAPIPTPLTPPIGSLRDDFYSFPDGCSATGRRSISVLVVSSGESKLRVGRAICSKFTDKLCSPLVQDRKPGCSAVC